MPFFFLATLVCLGVTMGSLARAAESAEKPPEKSAEKSAPTPAQAPTSAPPAATVNSAPKSVSVTRVVGEAGPRIVTSREVRINDAIGQVLAPTTANLGTKRKVIDAEDATFPAQVLKVLDEWTVFLEAAVIGSKSADKQEVTRLTKLVSDAWKGQADWERLEASPTEIKEIVERKLAAQSLERLKGDVSLVNVTDAEALQYFKKNRLRFGNLPFENFKDGIKAALVRSQTERRLTEWRSVLRKKYRVRNFVGA